VNPATDVLNGERCYHTVAEVPEPLDGVLVMVNAKAAKEVVEACVSRGVPRVWLHRGAGPGAVSDEAVTLCRDAGIDVVDGACPLMFAEPVARFHRVHRWFAKRRFAA
jgi:predicted CoA-binding protein